MTNYIDTIYNEKTRPVTVYPDQMCKHLFDMLGMKEGQRLLELGCGRGDFLAGFKKAGLSVAGLDLEKSSSDILKNIEVAYANVEKDTFPFANEAFDVVYSKSLIEHLHSPDHFMKESMRILKKGGKMIIMAPDWQSQHLIFYNDHTHVQPYTVTGLNDLMKIHGLENIKARLFYQLPVLWKYPALKVFSKMLQLLGPVKKLYKNKFMRWSRELMILAYGTKK